MNYFTKMRSYRSYGLYIIFITVPLRGDCLTLRALFDALFPSTPYKKLLMHSSQLHGVLDFVSHKEAHEQQWLQEIIAGRLVQLDRSVDALCQERFKCRTQDLEYLLIVLDKVALKMQEALKEVSPKERLFSLQKLISIQQKINRWL